MKGSPELPHQINVGLGVRIIYQTTNCDLKASRTQPPKKRIAPEERFIYINKGIYSLPQLHV